MNTNQTHKIWNTTGILSLIDHAVLQPNQTDAEMREQVLRLRSLPVASVCIKPYAVAMAVKALQGTKVKVGTVIGFPHGSALAAVKAAETAQAFRDGVSEVDMVVNVGKVLSGDWDYVRDDILAVLEVTRQNKGVIKVIFETDFLPEDASKIRLCEICTELAVDFVKTSTGYGFNKDSDGHFSYRGATEHDVRLMRQHTPPTIGIKPSGGVRSLDEVLKFVALGATRIGTGSTFSIYNEAIQRFVDHNADPSDTSVKVHEY